MHAIDLITPNVPPLRPQDSIGRALDWMEEFKVSHLPVVEGRTLVGIVKDQDLVDRNDPLATVSSIMARVELPFVREGSHLYEVIKLISQRGLTVVPVLDPMGMFLGTITEHQALKKFAEVGNIHEPGSIVVLELNVVDYSLFDIARIVEGNDGRILSVHGHTLPDSSRMEVTLKINLEDVSGILQAFERHDYFVKTTYQGSKFKEDLRDRYEGLMRYLEP